MSEAPQPGPKIIVVGEDEVHGLLRDCGAAWDVQHPVASVGQMWDDLSGHRLDPASVAVVFTDTVDASPGELETAIAAMAPAAATFLVAFRPECLVDLLARVREAATTYGADADAPVHVLGPESVHCLLDEVRATLQASGVVSGFPSEWAVRPGALTIGTGTMRERDPVPVEPVPVAVAPEPSAPPVVPSGSADPAVVPRVVPYLTPVASIEVPPAGVAAVEAHGFAPPVVTASSASVAAPIALAPAAMPAEQATRGGGAADGSWVRSSLRPRVVDPPADPHQAQPDPSSLPQIPGQVTIAVTSAKGGSGKSTTAMMLAAQIAQSSRRACELGQADRPLKVVLLDMDTRDGQVASLMGRYVPTSLNIRVQPCWDAATILGNLVHDPKLGIDCLLAPVRPRTADDVGPDFYRHVIRMLKTTHDVVILDTSVNYLDPLISTVCLPEATAILFVTTLATTSVQGMARALREITEPVDLGGMGINRRRIGVVVNQSITEVGMDRDQVLQAALRVPIVGAIPLATKDVLTCTNFNRMHQLLEHPLLGPAYFKLARTCMPNAALAPVSDADAPEVRRVEAAPIAPLSPHPVTPVLVGASQGHNGSAPPERRRGLFGRRS